jgi:predicted nucleotidyltransferase
MDINNPFYIEVLSAMNGHNVEYILVGGLAVSYHGYSRYTGDMDLWIKPDAVNMEKLYKTLYDLGYPENIIEDIKNNREIESPTPIKLKDDYDRLKVDLMTNTFQKEFSWQECFDKSEKIYVEDVKIPIVQINQLISMKENTKRLDNSMKDLVDAQELRKIQKLKESQRKQKRRGRRI